MRVGSSRLKPRQLILTLKEQLELSFVFAVGRLAKIPDSIEPNHVCVCHTSLAQGFRLEGQEDPPTARPRLARGEGVGFKRELQMELNSSIFRREVMIPHCFLEFKSSFSINIFFNRIFLLFLKDIKTIPISSNTRLYILTRFLRPLLDTFSS